MERSSQSDALKIAEEQAHPSLVGVTPNLPAQNFCDTQICPLLPNVVAATLQSKASKCSADICRNNNQSQVGGDQSTQL